MAARRAAVRAKGAPSGLCERDAELAALDDFLDAAVAGQGGLMIIEGPPGIGKTALVRAAAARTRELGRALTLTARCSELEMDFAFGMVRQCLERELRGRTKQNRSSLLTGAAAHAAPVLGIADEGDVAVGPDATARALYGLYWLLANMAEQGPVFLALDDLHWADQTSLVFLDFVLPDRLAELPVAVVATARSSELTGGEEMLARLASKAQATLKLRPLSSDGTRQLIETRIGNTEREFVEAAHALVAGNPLFLEQLLAELLVDEVAPTREAVDHLQRYGPPSVSRIVLARLVHLHPAARSIARAVAILGGEASLDHVKALGGLEHHDARAGIDELVRVSLLRGGHTLSFVHPIVENAIYADLGPAERSRDHRLAASLLAGAGESPERVAAHLMASAPEGDPQAMMHLRCAAQVARDRGAPESAAAYLRRALAEGASGPHADGLRAELGMTELTGLLPGAAEHLGAALSETSDAELRAVLAGALGLALAQQGRLPEAVEALLSELLDVRHSPEEIVMLEAALGTTACFALDLDRATLDERVDEAARRLEGETPAERELLVAQACRIMHRGEETARAVAIVERCLEHGLAAETMPGSATDAAIFMCLVWGDALDLAMSWASSALTRGRAVGSPFAVAMALNVVAFVHHRRGELKDAEAAAADGLAIRGDLTTGARALLTALIDALVDAGEIERARALVSDQALDALPEAFDLALLLESRSRLCAAEGNWEGALADARAAGRLFDRWGVMGPPLAGWRASAAIALVALGRPEDGRRLAQEELELARRCGVRRSIGLALRALAMTQRGEQQIRELSDSVEVLEESEDRLEHAKSLVELGAALRRANRRAEARGPLSAGMELAHRCGASTLAARAREELAATGARPRRLMLSGVDSLTASELRVARLAADGLSNPRIAQALFVTRKTVETHLGSVYRKLDISSREALGEVLRDEGAT